MRSVKKTSLTDDQIISLGGYIASDPETNVGDMEVLEIQNVPQTIEETSDDILQNAIRCEITGRPFRIVAAELEFYRKMKVPLPVIHPTPRMRVFAEFKPTSKKYKTTCDKCQKDMESMFNPAKGFILYCEKCYQQEVV